MPPGKFPERCHGVLCSNRPVWRKNRKTNKKRNNKAKRNRKGKKKKGLKRQGGKKITGGRKRTREQKKRGKGKGKKKTRGQMRGVRQNIAFEGENCQFVDFGEVQSLGSGCIDGTKMVLKNK